MLPRMSQNHSEVCYVCEQMTINYSCTFQFQWGCCSIWPENLRLRLNYLHSASQHIYWRQRHWISWQFCVQSPNRLQLRCRVCLASSVMASLQHIGKEKISVCQSPTKIRVYQSLCCLYCYMLQNGDMAVLASDVIAFNMKRQRQNLGIHWSEHVSNAVMLSRMGLKSVKGHPKWVPHCSLMVVLLNDGVRPSQSGIPFPSRLITHHFFCQSHD